MGFFDEPKKSEQTANEQPKINLADLIKEDKYRESYLANKEVMRIPEILDTPIVITGYEESTMRGMMGEDKPCFVMHFYLADDAEMKPHYIKTEATRLWQYLKAINAADSEILSSGTVTTMVCEGQLKGKYSTKYYYFAGTE